MDAIGLTQLRRFQTALVLIATLVVAPDLHAQSPASVAGNVTDSTGVPIIGAEVSISGTALTATTGERGEFKILGVPTGPATVRVRRLGFAPASVDIQVSRGDEANTNLSLRLTQIATRLEPVVVRSNRVRYTGRLAGYYERLERGGAGHFIARDQIDRENPRMLTHLLNRVPGVTTVRIRAGGSGIRLRHRNCWPLVWIDGTPMPAGDVDLDAFAPSTLHGIELYLGSTTAPARYIGTRDLSSCGTILLWSRGPDTDPVVRPQRPERDLEQLVSSHKVFTADQVDRRAELDGASTPDVAYPPSLYAAAVRGTVVAEFVVDSAGRIEKGTFGIVSSPHPFFGEAVKAWAETAVYAPALRAGVAVRQFVQQAFTFFPGSRRARELASQSRTQ